MAHRLDADDGAVEEVTAGGGDVDVSKAPPPVSEAKIFKFVGRVPRNEVQKSKQFELVRH